MELQVFMPFSHERINQFDTKVSVAQCFGAGVRFLGNPMLQETHSF